MRTIFAMLLVLGTSQGAMATCVSQPDNAASAYVLNGMQQTLRLGSELASMTALRNRAVAIDATLGSLQRQLLQQRLQNAFRQPLWNSLTYRSTWP